MLLEYSIPSLKPTFQKDMKQGAFYDSIRSAIFFNEEEKNDELQNDYGCIYIDSKNLNKAHFLFNWHLIPFTKPRPMYNSWGFMNQLRHPCNALVVTDNYLFAKATFEDNKRQLSENLLIILFQLMPSQLKIDFHLTILGSPIDRKGNQQEYIKNTLQDLHQYILTRLKEKFTYTIRLSLLVAPFHDRNILTNYTWINSGNSFTYFENKRLHSNTNLMFHPVTHVNNTYNPFYHIEEQSEENTSVSEVWENIRASCGSWACKTPNETTLFKFASNVCVNRLLK